MDPRAYFDSALSAFHRAASLTGVETRACTIAGGSVRLRFAGQAMTAVMWPALAHLDASTSADRPALDVHVWDSASTGTPISAPDWGTDAYSHRGEIFGFAGSHIRAVFNIEASILELRNEATGQSVVWAKDAARVPTAERGAPLRGVLAWWLASEGRQLAHAGAVGQAAGAVLLAGKGGSGKSNTALAALGDGLIYLADDYCALEPGDVPLAHSLYATAKVHAADLSRLSVLSGGMAANIGRLNHEKALFFLADEFRSQLRSSLPIRAVVMPRVEPDAPSRLVTASSFDAVRAIAMSTMPQVPYAGEEVVRTISAVVRQVPAFHLTIGRDAARAVPRMLRELTAGRVGLVRG